MVVDDSLNQIHFILGEIMRWIQAIEEDMVSNLEWIELARHLLLVLHPLNKIIYRVWQFGIVQGMLYFVPYVLVNP
jgi:hypothetical protein